MICEICEEKEVSTSCPLCGRYVCIDHIRGICAVCLETLCEVCMRRLSMAHCMVCGRLVCRLDSRRLGLGRLCIRCLGGAQ